MDDHQSFKATFIRKNEAEETKRWMLRPHLWFLFSFLAFTIISFIHGRGGKQGYSSPRNEAKYGNPIESEKGVVAADNGYCSEVGASVLRKGGHAVDAAVATSLCLGVMNPSSSGIGGGGFMILWSSSTSEPQAFDMRETAPSAASQNMYENDTSSKSTGALSIGVPGELAGLHEAWSRHGRLPWPLLFQPAISLAKNGFPLPPYLGVNVAKYNKSIMGDPGLRKMFAPNGTLLQTGDICYNEELGNTLHAIAEEGPKALYNGSIGENLVRDLKNRGGIITMEDLRNYKVEVRDAMRVDVMGHTLLGMPPPSSGTLGISMVLNMLDSYGTSNAAKGGLGMHRLIEALKHMFAMRMKLGDPKFVNTSEVEANMLSYSFANDLRKQKIFDNATFPPEYYMTRWSQLKDDGTSHFCIVDADGNAVSMTTTVNAPFGAKILSPSSGIVLNNEMDDFSTPTEISPDKLPPAPSNFVKPNKRPLSSMTPLIILKDGQLSGVMGASGAMRIIPAVAQVFINHYVLGMEPFRAVLEARIYHKLVPNVVEYENWTAIEGGHRFDIV